MTYRFYITIGSSQVEVHPLNFMKTSLVDAQDEGEIFYRRKFNGTLRFIGDDFDLIYMVEQVDPCTEIVLTIEQRDSGAATYHTYWEGYFSTTDGKFDLDNCTFDVSFKTYDNYKLFEQYGDVEYNILDIATVVTTTTRSFTYTRNRWLIDVIEYLADKIIPGVSVTSSFFNDATNPVTGIASRTNLLTIAQKSDIKRPTSSNPATVANLSWNELMHILRMFNVYWVYDGTDIIVEHLSYFEQIDGMDLRTQEIAKKANKYSYDKIDMPKYEKFSWMEASGSAFIGVPIWYDNPCVNQDANNNVKEYSNRVTTDIEMIELNNNSVSDEGFVILTNYWDGSVYRVWIETAKLGSEFKYNMDLSWANLHYYFFRHGRVLDKGYLNNKLTDFASIIPTKLQEINAIVCYEDNYDPADLITTELGEVWLDGEKGHVKTASIKPDGHVKFNLLYGSTQLSGEIEPPAKWFWIVEDLHLHNDSYVYVYLSEPAAVDMVFWIWVGETYCDEVTVPAGEMYHSHLLTSGTALDPMEYGDCKYNIGAAAFTGWTIKYSGEGCAYPNDPAYPIIEITDTDCGDAGSEPPPPVAPTATVTVAAGETWYITDESASISIGSTTLKITFKPHDCSIPRSHVVYIRVFRNGAIDGDSTVYVKELYQVTKNITVTAALSGDVYLVVLRETL